MPARRVNRQVAKLANASRRTAENARYRNENDSGTETEVLEPETTSGIGQPPSIFATLARLSVAGLVRELHNQMQLAPAQSRLDPANRSWLDAYRDLLAHFECQFAAEVSCRHDLVAAP